MKRGICTIQIKAHFHKKLGLLSSASVVFRIYTNTPRLVESDLSSAMLCRKPRNCCCINFLQWAKFPSQLLVPTPGSHLTVPSFLPTQLWEWMHSKSDHRNNLQQRSSVAELWCKKINFLNEFACHPAVMETHRGACSSDGDGLACPTQLNSYEFHLTC